MTTPLALFGRKPSGLFSTMQASVSARDYPELGMLTCRTGQVLTYARTGNGLGIGSDGRVNMPGANQPRFTWVDGDADGVRETMLRTASVGGTNLALRSDDPTNASWTKAQVTAVASTTIRAPDGTLAIKLLETAVTNTHGITQAVTITAGNFVTYSCYLRAAERARFQLRALNATDIVACVFRTDLLTVTSTASGTSTIQDSGMEALGNGWYRGWVTGKVNAASTAITLEVNLVDSANATNYAGVATSGAHVWGIDFKQGNATGSSVTESVQTLGATVTAGPESTLFTPAWNLGDSATLYIRFARPLWGSHTGSREAGNAALFAWGTIAAANSFSVYLDTASPHGIRCALYDAAAATQITVAQSLPAAASVGRTIVEVCVQLSTLFTAAQARVDVGAGFGALSTAVGVLTTPSGAAAIGSSPASLLQLGAGWSEFRMQNGLYTLAQMRDNY